MVGRKRQSCRHRAWGQPLWGGGERQSPGLSVPVQEGRAKLQNQVPAGRAEWAGQAGKGSTDISSYMDILDPFWTSHSADSISVSIPGTLKAFLNVLWESCIICIPLPLCRAPPSPQHLPLPSSKGSPSTLSTGSDGMQSWTNRLSSPPDSFQRLGR